jgi:hypothetical protein
MSAFSHSQPRLRRPKVSAAVKEANRFTEMEKLLKKLKSMGFTSLGQFLSVLFYNHKRWAGKPDPRGKTHAKVVGKFLRGRSKIKMSQVIDLIYKHPKATPTVQDPERDLAFDPGCNQEAVLHAQTCLSIWATRLVGDKLYSSIGALSRRDTENPNDRIGLCAKTNGRNPNARTITWDDLANFRIANLLDKYKSRRGRLVWYITECMAGPRKKGVVVQRVRRPHSMVSVSEYSAVSTCPFAVDTSYGYQLLYCESKSTSHRRPSSSSRDMVFRCQGSHRYKTYLLSYRPIRERFDHPKCVELNE